MISLIKSLRTIFNPRYYFCQGKDSKRRNSMKNTKILKSRIDNDPSYVRKYNEDIGQQLIYNIENYRWEIAKKMLLMININELQSWFLLRKISNALNNSCNQLKSSQINKDQINDLLSVMVLLRFEPIKKGLFDRRYNQYDDSTEFINQMQKHIKENSISKDPDYFYQISRKLLHTNPSLFLSIREEFQQNLLNNLNTLMESRSLINDLLVRGCISNYWTKDFRQKILNKNVSDSYLKALKFEDVLIPTKIEKSPQKSNITQNEIMNILEGYGYAVQENILVNGYEIDFLINKNLVVQYNGHHHYIINSKQMIPTAKHRWKQSVLTNRGFQISSISFAQWKTLHNFEEKREYIVSKIQNDWLNAYKQSQSKLK